MISFAGFVVELKNTHAIGDEGQAVLETLIAAPGRLRQLPDHDFGEPALADDLPLAKQKSRLHVGIYANMKAIGQRCACRLPRRLHKLVHPAAHCAGKRSEMGDQSNVQVKYRTAPER